MTEFKPGDRVLLTNAYVQAEPGTIIVPSRKWHAERPEVEFVVHLDSGDTYYARPDELVRMWVGDPTSKPTNPKDVIGSDKLPLHLWPETATAMGCLGMLEGALKYGRSNWRETGVRVTIYVDALKRHTNAYVEGEDLDPDSQMPHLAHMLACIAIIVDADAAGKLNDDRQYPGGYRGLVEKLTPLVKQAKENHADKNPKHWTIADA